MSWVTLNESNWRQFLVPVQEVEPSVTTPNRAVFAGSECSATVPGGSTDNTIACFMAFGYDNPYTQKAIGWFRIKLVGLEQDAIPPGEPYVQRLVGPGQWIGDDGQVIPAGEFAPVTGGIQIRVATSGGSDLFASSQKAPGTTVAAKIGEGGTAVIESGTAMSIPTGTSGRVVGGTGAYEIAYWDGPGDPTEEEPIQKIQQIGRVTRCIVSGYSRDKVHSGLIYAPEKRALITELNGALPPGVTITRATWNSLDTYVAAMSQPAIFGRSVQVMLQAQVDGYCGIRLDLELSNGERFAVWHSIRVLPARYMTTDTFISGPTQLVATA